MGEGDVDGKRDSGRVAREEKRGGVGEGVGEGLSGGRRQRKEWGRKGGWWEEWGRKKGRWEGTRSRGGVWGRDKTYRGVAGWVGEGRGKRITGAGRSMSPLSQYGAVRHTYQHVSP